MSDDDERAQEILPITSRIGRVAAAWARFEYRVAEIIWHLANIDIQAGACITANIPSPQSRLRTLVALVRLRGGQGNLINELNSFVVRADTLGRQRNRYIHDPWIHGDGGTMRVEVTADRRLKFETITTSLEEMDSLWREVADAIKELEKMYGRIKTELPPWPDTQYLQSLGKDPVVAHLSPNND